MAYVSVARVWLEGNELMEESNISDHKGSESWRNLIDGARVHTPTESGGKRGNRELYTPYFKKPQSTPPPSLNHFLKPQTPTLIRKLPPTFSILHPDPQNITLSSHHSHKLQNNPNNPQTFQIQ